MASPVPPPKTLLSFLYNVSYDPDRKKAFHADPDGAMQQDFNLSPEVRDVFRQIGAHCTPGKPLDPSLQPLLAKLLGFIGDELTNEVSPTFW